MFFSRESIDLTKIKPTQQKLKKEIENNPDVDYVLVYDLSKKLFKTMREKEILKKIDTSVDIISVNFFMDIVETFFEAEDTVIPVLTMVILSNLN